MIKSLVCLSIMTQCECDCETIKPTDSIILRFVIASCGKKNLVMSVDRLDALISRRGPAVQR